MVLSSFEGGEENIGLLKQAVYTAGTGNLQVQLLVALTGEGLVVQLYGGDKPHIGAVAISLPRRSLSDNTKISCNTTVIPMLGHKDDEVAKPIAERIVVACGQPVVVIAGLHVDNAGPAEIKKIVENAYYAVEMFIGNQ